MGVFKTIPTAQILPSQDYLKEDTLKFIVSCLENGELDNLPPTPFVRKDPKSSYYVAIDGHNLIAVYDYRGLDIDVYIASSAKDGLEPTTAAIIQRNNDLAAKYESSLKQAYALQKKGIGFFVKLRKQYPLISN